MSPPNTSRRGPIGHRFLVLLFSVGVSVLAFWLLGYVLRDIDQIDGPSYQSMVTEALPPQLIEQQEQLAEQRQENQIRKKEVEKRRDLLRQSVENSQQTINQLLELQRLSLEKDAQLSSDQQNALAENLQSFLDRQQQSQTLSEELVNLETEAQGIEEQSRELTQDLQSAKEPLDQQFQTAQRAHQWRLAAWKLGLLLPFVVIAGALFWKLADGTYAPLIYAFGVALIGRVLLVMHEHFPAIYFRYLLIGTALCVAVWVLVKLLQTISNPSHAWLIKQYREAYSAFLCPQCEYPIRRGPLKFAAWTRRTLRKRIETVTASDAVEGDVPYTCPSCATKLFETCEQCGKTRASLLPACDKCGAVQEERQE
jgi:predicted RNA-binding Zn-ribbon protein involved in translation (DUF1610 family)